MAQAPANTPALGMGDPLFDRSSFGPDCPESIIEALMSLQAVMAASGWLCPARGSGTRYQNAVVRYDGSNWILYAARPDTPLNPDTVSLTSGGSAVIVELDNVVVNATTTTINFSTNFTVVDAGGGQVDVDVTGGGGGSYTSSDPIVLTGSDFSLSYSTGLTLSSGDLIVDIGDGLEAVGNKVQAKAHTYIDISANGIAVDLTEVASYNGAGDQYLRNNAGTFQWATLPPDTNTTYTAGAGSTLTGTVFSADVHNASHVGLVDPTTGDDSTANDAQIGILWHEIENFDNGRNQLHGHVADDASKPKVTCKTTEDWLELLESYDSSKSMVIYNDSTNAGTEGDERVRWVESPQKVIWGLDPDGGHTITTTGTTLTLTLKVTKYTFDAVNFVSAVDADVTVTYTGTECA
jgi:hypothetical protein